MKRKSNITVWQLRLFESLDRDIMVMHRDEEEVFDNALHVFFDKEYYDAYIGKAKKYSQHSYSYHEDKLGEAIYQVFEEKIQGLVLHISTMESDNKSTLCEDKYLTAKDLRLLQDAADSYHYLYTVAIERMSREEAIARIWTKNVYIIGKLPDFTMKVEEKQTIELMTMRRKHDGSVGTKEDYDYESVKVFLSPESAMHFNPDKKPVNRYKLSFLAGFVKGKLQIVIEPHRNYWLEFDPANLDLGEYLKVPVWKEEKVIARIEEYARQEELYILLAPAHSDYRACVGTPFLVRLQENNVMMYVFEKYEDAVNYVLENAAVLPVLDGTYPIGVLKKSDKLLNLETMLAVAHSMGVHHINLDMDTDHALGCKLPYFMEKAGYETEPEKLLSKKDYEELKQEKEGTKTYRFPAIPFYDTENPYAVSEERKQELVSHIDADYDRGITYMAGCTLPEIMTMIREVGLRFDEARTREDEENKKLYNRLMNQMTIPLTEALLEKPYIYTLRNEDGSFTLKNNLPYLLVTNRFESARKGEGKLAMGGIDNENFLKKLEEASRIAIVTDGPNCLCFADLHLMAEVVKQQKKAQPLQAEVMLYMTEGLNLSYEEASFYYKRLKSDNGIFVEFVACVRNGEYAPMGLITIEGKTAKSIAEEKGMNPLQAYDALLALKEGVKPVASLTQAQAAEEPEAAKQESSEETKQKSFLGKLFGKDK